MKNKRFAIVLAAAALILIIAGCSGSGEEETATPAPAAAAETVSEAETDVVTTASIVNTPSDFREAVSADGNWIIAVLEDLSFDEEIVVEGTFIPDDKAYRKLAFYAQDENRTITDRYTVTAPRMTIRSENTRIQGGTFSGDLYVEAPGFHLVDGRVDGDIYFAAQEYLDSFTADDKSEVTGETVVQ